MNAEYRSTTKVYLFKQGKAKSQDRRALLIMIGTLVGLLNALGMDSGLRALFAEYLAEVREAQSSPEAGLKKSERIQSLNEKWRKEFQLAISRTQKNTPGWGQIASELMALEQAAGNYEAALQLNDLLVKECKDSATSFSLKANKAEVLYNLMLLTNNVASRTRALEAFGNAHELIQVPYEPLGKLSLLRKYASVLEQNQNYIKAISVLKEAAGLCGNAVNGSLEWTGVDLPRPTEVRYLMDAVRVRVQRLKDYGTAEKEMVEVLEVAEEDSRTPLYERYLSWVDSQRGPTYKAKLTKWLSSARWEPAAFPAAYRLAEALFRDKEYASAANWYSKLLGTELVQQSEGNSGAYSLEAGNIVYNLAECLCRLGEHDKARTLYKIFTRMFPKDVRAEWAERKGWQ